MKILVTGAAGFIGFHLVKKLLDRGEQVVGIDNINSYYDVNLKYDRLAVAGISRDAELWHQPVSSRKYSGYTFIRMNVEDREQLAQLFAREKFDKVCHLAAQAGVRYSLENPYVYVTSNVLGFVTILEACRHHHIRHLVYASSSSVYGNNTKMPLSTHDNVDHPISLYAATKKSNELMAHTYSHLFNLPTTGLRFFTVYGPWGRPDMALFLFTKAILENKPIKVFNNGNMVRDFTYIDDIVEGVTRVLDNPPGQRVQSKEQRTSNNRQQPVIRYKLPATPTQLEQSGNPAPAGQQKKLQESLSVSPSGGMRQQGMDSGIDGAEGVPPYKVYNIGNSSPVRLMDYITAIETHLGKTAVKDFLPMQPGDVPRTEADVTDLVADLGYRPSTTVVEGIRSFIEWYKAYFGIGKAASQKIETVSSKINYPG